MEDHGVKLIHHDEENAALDFEEQHFAHPSGGGKEIADNYLICGRIPSDASSA